MPHRLQQLIQRLKYARTPHDIEELKENIITLIPMAKIMFHFDQQNESHCYDLWEHCVHTVLHLPSDTDDDMLYLAALLHDIGKPDCQCRGKNPDDHNMHYYGHPIRSMEIVRDEVLPYLEQLGIPLADSDRKRLLYYVEYHDDRVSLRIKHLKRHLKMVSFEIFQNLMRLEIADAKAHTMVPFIEERIRICSQWAGSYGVEMYHDRI